MLKKIKICSEMLEKTCYPLKFQPDRWVFFALAKYLTLLSDNVKKVGGWGGV